MENTPQTNTAPAPESSGAAPSTTTDLSPTQTSEQSQVLDLDSVEKFKWAGQEMTLKDLQQQVMRQSDYTRKTQALAEERRAFEQQQAQLANEKKFSDNLDDDLEAVRKNPELVAEFLSTYPKRYHRFLDTTGVEWKNRPGTVEDPRIEKLLAWQKSQEERDAASYKERENAYLAQIDAMEAKFTAKYQLADTDKVLSMAQQWRKQNPDSKEIPEKVWDQLYKKSHESIEAGYKKYQSAQNNAQTKANQEGADIPGGGGIPAQAPVRHKTIKEASDAARAHFKIS